jgi:hypothetical protein
MLEHEEISKRFPDRETRAGKNPNSRQTKPTRNSYLRNCLVHENFAIFPFEKTAEEVYE